jgi:putative endonuclease
MQSDKNGTSSGEAVSEPTHDRRRALGRQGEDLAAAYLGQQGYEIIMRNWHTRSGELDIVARDGDWLVFVEVRTRRIGGGASVPALGSPEESVTPRKQIQLVTLADAYLFELPWGGLWRIDVIALELRADGSVARLNHLRDAVGGMA